MSGHGQREPLTSAEIAAIRADRAAGMGIQRLAFKWRVGSRRVCAICGADAHVAPGRGRRTEIGAEALAAMRRARADGMPLADIARIWRISEPRARRMVEGVEVRRKFSGPAPVALDTMAFRAAGVPDTPANREACRGHSRAWMRLYRLRVLHPDSYEGADAANCCSILHRNGAHIYC